MLKIKPPLEKLERVALARKKREGLRLDLNENPDGLPDDFIRQVFADIDGDYLSTYPYYGSLLDKIAAHNSVIPENICLAPGSDGVIKYIFESFISPGDKVLLTDPTFAMYSVYCDMFEATSVNVPYGADFTFSAEAFLEQIRPDIQLAVLVNPNNPTGIAISQNDIEAIAQRCRANNVLLIVDEAYFYYYEQTSAPLIRKYDNILVLRTFSKLCGLASLRLGYALGEPNLITYIAKVSQTFDVNGIAVAFTEKLLDNQQLMEEQITEINKGKAYLENRLSEAGLFFRMGLANFVLIKCPGRVDALMTSLAERGVLVSGGFKNQMLKDYLRVTIGHTATMEKFWRIFIELWKKENGA